MSMVKYFFASVMLVSLLFSGKALAHKVNVFAYADGGKIYTESYFPSGDPVEKGRLKVYDSGGSQVAEGETDKQGHFSFEIPKIDDFRIVIDAGMGHKNSFTLKKSQVQAGKQPGRQP